MAASIKIPTIFTATDKFSDTVRGMTKTSDRMAASLSRVSHKMDGMSRNMAIGGAAIVGGLGLAVNSATKFEDKMADVAKTTGLKGDELDSLGNSILNMSKKTRSSIEDLQEIAVIGGQLGVAKDELLGFTEASNKFSVALAGDYSGGLETAVLAVGKLNSLYSDTKALKIDEHLNRSGSAFNQLSSEGKASVENINDFASRVGTLPGVLKPSFTATAGLGAFLEEVGINSERGASGFSTLMLTAGKELPSFARQMGLGTDAARELLEQDPVKFAQKFSRSLNGLKPDELAKRLKELKIGGQESIKVVGALGDETDRLTALMDSSSKAFENATSLTDEYNVKNETTAAKIAMAKNNLEALSITIGTQVAPILSKLIDVVIPIVESFGKWVEENPKLSRTLAYLGLGLLSLAGILKGVSFAMNVASVAVKAYAVVTKGLTVAQWLINAAMWANPIGLIIAGIVALIAVVAVIIAYYDEWGASMALMLGPLGLVINLIQSFRRNWDMIKKAFEEGGIIGGLLAIRATIFDALLMPMQQFLELISNIPGMGDIAGKGVKFIEELRGNLGVDTGDNEALPSTTQASNDGVSRSITENNSNVRLDIVDKGGNVGNVHQDGNIPIMITNTSGNN